MNKSQSDQLINRGWTHLSETEYQQYIWNSESEDFNHIISLHNGNFRIEHPEFAFQKGALFFCRNQLQRLNRLPTDKLIESAIELIHSFKFQVGGPESKVIIDLHSIFQRVGIGTYSISKSENQDVRTYQLRHQILPFIYELDFGENQPGQWELRTFRKLNFPIPPLSFHEWRKNIRKGKKISHEKRVPATEAAYQSYLKEQDIAKFDEVDFTDSVFDQFIEESEKELEHIRSHSKENAVANILKHPELWWDIEFFLYNEGIGWLHRTAYISKKRNKVKELPLFLRKHLRYIVTHLWAKNYYRTKDCQEISDAWNSEIIGFDIKESVVRKNIESPEWAEEFEEMLERFSRLLAKS